MQNLLGESSASFSVGNKIRMSSDGETWMMTIDHFNPTTQLIQFISFLLAMLTSKKNATKGSNRFDDGIRISIYEEKTIQKPEKESDISASRKSLNPPTC